MNTDLFIEQEVGSRLIDRLTCLKINPKYVLCLGNTADYFTIALQDLFPQATIFTNSAEVAKYDLIFINCNFNPESNLNNLFKTMHDKLNINGALLFSSFGPDTLRELSISSDWPDMHNIGDILVQQQFSNPVMDMENLYIEYDSLKDLLEDLKLSGRYEIEDIDIPELMQPYTANFEIVYGLAWENTQRQLKDQAGNVLIAVDSIKVL